MSIRLELTEMEAVVIETLVHQAANALEDELQWAEENEDWDTFEAIMEEFEFLYDVGNALQIQMVDDEDIEWDSDMLMEDIYA